MRRSNPHGHTILTGIGYVWVGIFLLVLVGVPLLLTILILA